MNNKLSANMHKLSLVTLVVLGATSAFAAEPQQWYVGGNIGQSKADFDFPATIVPLTGPGFAVTSTSERDRYKSAYKLYGGYRLTRNFAIEGGFFDLGDNRYSFNTTPAGTLNGISDVRGVNIDVVGILPITDRFSAFGRVGAAYAQNRTHFTNIGAVPFNGSNPRSNGTNLKVGAGLEYAFNDNWSVRAEIERYRIKDPIRNKGNIDMASVGLVYYFGEKARAPMTQTYVAPPVVAAPPPPPPPAPRAVEPPPPPAPAPVMAPPPPPPPAYSPPDRPAKPGRY
ncbi:MAG: porin family protein [Pseudomonadota bacterium]